MFQSRAPQTLRLVRAFGGVGFEGENRKGFAVAPSYVEKRQTQRKGFRSDVGLLAVLLQHTSLEVVFSKLDSQAGAAH